MARLLRRDLFRQGSAQMTRPLPYRPDQAQPGLLLVVDALFAVLKCSRVSPRPMMLRRVTEMHLRVRGRVPS